MISLIKPEEFKQTIEVVACYVKYNETHLFLKRQPNKHSGNKYGLPAGKVDSNEKKEDAMIRELFEETGISIEKKDLVLLGTLYVIHEDSHILYHSFNINLDKKPEVVLSQKEHTKYIWVTIEDSFSLDLMHDLEDCNKLYFS